MSSTSPTVDVAIVGFGFSGLATLMNLARAERPGQIVVVAPDHSGYGMGAWSGDEEHFVDWLRTAQAAHICAELEVTRPGTDDFAPRMLFARYLNTLRETALRQPADRGHAVRWISGRARAIEPADGEWIVRTTGGAIRARACVLALGNDARHVFGELRHPRLRDGPWDWRRPTCRRTVVPPS